MSIDRIDPAGGYTMGNVRFVCLIANVAMNHWGEKPLHQLAEALMEKKRAAGSHGAASPRQRKNMRKIS